MGHEGLWGRDNLTKGRQEEGRGVGGWAGAGLFLQAADGGKWVGMECKGGEGGGPGVRGGAGVLLGARP